MDKWFLMKKYFGLNFNPPFVRNSKIFQKKKKKTKRKQKLRIMYQLITLSNLKKVRNSTHQFHVCCRVLVSFLEVLRKMNLATAYHPLYTLTFIKPTPSRFRMSLDRFFVDLKNVALKKSGFRPNIQTKTTVEHSVLLSLAVSHCLLLRQSKSLLGHNGVKKKRKPKKALHTSAVPLLIELQNDVG